MSETTSKRRRGLWAERFWRLLVFLGGTLFLALGSWVLIGAPLDPTRLSALFQDAQLGDHGLYSLVLHLFVSALVSGGLMVSWGWLKKPAHTRPVVTRRLIVSKGAVFLETLIALPIVLLFILGLSQLAMNNIASMMFNLAVFESARTTWVWEGEDCGTCDALAIAQDYARIQAAAALAPVVSAAGTVGERRSPRQARAFEGRAHRLSDASARRRWDWSVRSLLSRSSRRGEKRYGLLRLRPRRHTLYGTHGPKVHRSL